MITTYLLWGIDFLAVPVMAEAGDHPEVFEAALYFDGIDDYVWSLPRHRFDRSTSDIGLMERVEDHDS